PPTCASVLGNTTNFSPPTPGHTPLMTQPICNHHSRLRTITIPARSAPTLCLTSDTDLCSARFTRAVTWETVSPRNYSVTGQWRPLSRQFRDAHSISSPATTETSISELLRIVPLSFLRERRPIFVGTLQLLRASRPRVSCSQPASLTAPWWGTSAAMPGLSPVTCSPTFESQDESPSAIALPWKVLSMPSTSSTVLTSQT